MDREYIRVKRPSSFPHYTNLLKELDDDFWKSWVFFHLISFYKNFNRAELKKIIESEQQKEYPRTERVIAKYVRTYLKNNREFDLNFKVYGEVTNDEDVEGNYDILIDNTYWKNSFFFECKNLNCSQDLANKYVQTKIYPKNKPQQDDGGVYRYFNGKYAQSQDFGGMLGFILDGDVGKNKEKIQKKLEDKFDITPEGDLIKIINNSIAENTFTFDSLHNRKNNNFTIHHLLFEVLDV